MDPAAEALMRSAIHDLANVLSGIRGILELSDRTAPLSPRNRSRLEAVIEDGMSILEKSRHLAMDTVPPPQMEGGPSWRHHLEERLRPLGTMFQTQFELTYEGDPMHDLWPGEQLRGFAQAVTRQVLPYVQGSSLRIHGHATADRFQLTWSPAPELPESLAEPDALRPRDISARWALAMAAHLRIRLHLEGESLVATLPRP